MAYDPNDKDDKKIVDGLIAAALEEQAAEHAADVKGLKDKNKDLIKELREARAGKDFDPAELARLEGELETNKTELKQAKKDLVKATKDLEETTGKLTEESTFAQNLLIDNGLSEHLATAKVATEFIPAVRALLRPQITIKADADGRKPVVGDKSLGDFITEWSQGDQGKVYVAASVNAGGNAPGGRANGGTGGKTMSRAAYEDLQRSNPASAASFFKDGGTLSEAA